MSSGVEVETKNFLSEALNLINSVYNGLSLEYLSLIFHQEITSFLMTIFIIFQFLYFNPSQLGNKMNYDNINIIFIINMVDLVGNDVHMSNILSLKP